MRARKIAAMSLIFVALISSTIATIFLVLSRTELTIWIQGVLVVISIVSIFASNAMSPSSSGDLHTKVKAWARESRFHGVVFNTVVFLIFGGAALALFGVFNDSQPVGRVTTAAGLVTILLGTAVGLGMRLAADRE
jgi:hypothetical protein